MLSLKTASLTIIFLAGFFLSNVTHALPPLEPNDAFLVNEDINSITGLYIREYSLSQNGVIDYKTARQIVLSLHNEYGNSVVHTKEHPLFYWYDSNHNGQVEMWIDQKVEGCLCDVIRYTATYQE